MNVINCFVRKSFKISGSISAWGFFLYFLFYYFYTLAWSTWMYLVEQTDISNYFVS